MDILNYLFNLFKFSKSCKSLRVADFLEFKKEGNKTYLNSFVTDYFSTKIPLESISSGEGKITINDSIQMTMEEGTDCFRIPICSEFEGDDSGLTAGLLVSMINERKLKIQIDTGEYVICFDGTKYMNIGPVTAVYDTENVIINRSRCEIIIILGDVYLKIPVGSIITLNKLDSSESGQSPSL